MRSRSRCPVDKKRDDLLDDADDTAPVFDFFKSGQKKIFEKALEQIPNLKGCQVHTSVMLSQVDIQTFKRLGIQLTCEPIYEHKSILHNA